MPDNDDASAAPPPAARQPDYWTFVHVAADRLTERFSDEEVGVSHLALSLNRASETLKRVSEAAVHRPEKLSWNLFRVLFVLWNVGPVDQAHLTQLTNHSKATVSNLVGTLVERGLVARQASESDGRTWTVALTPEGAATVERLYLEQNELFTAWAGVLSAEDVTVLRRLLDKLMDRRDAFGVPRQDS